MSSSSDSPYNPRNRVIADDVLNAFLVRYAGAPPRDADLYRKALTHRSYCTRKNENFLEGNVRCPPGCVPLQEESNERLEFLGDAVLSLVVAAYLVDRYPDEKEGFMTQMRTKIVNGNMVARLCAMSGLHEYVIVSRQVEEDSAGGGRMAKNVLEDAFEAFIGATFVDQGFDAAKRFIVSFLEEHVDFTDLVKQLTNYKDALSKYFQQFQRCAPVYKESQIAHTNKSKSRENGDTSYGLTVCVYNGAGVVVGTGRGTMLKDAQNNAAKAALAFYGQPI